VGLRWHPKPQTRHTARAPLGFPALVCLAGLDLDQPVLLQPVQRLQQPLRTGPRDRLSRLLAPAQQLLVSLAMPRPPTPTTGRLKLLGIRFDPRDLRLLAAAGLLRQPLLRRLERRPAPLLRPQTFGQL